MFRRACLLLTRKFLFALGGVARFFLLYFGLERKGAVFSLITKFSSYKIKLFYDTGAFYGLPSAVEYIILINCSSFCRGLLNYFLEEKYVVKDVT